MLTVERTTAPRQKQEKSTLVFGQTFTDHMLHLDWDDQDGWRGPRIAPYGDLSISPAASSLHYALQVHAHESRTTIRMTATFCFAKCRTTFEQCSCCSIVSSACCAGPVRSEVVPGKHACRIRCGVLLSATEKRLMRYVKAEARFVFRPLVGWSGC